MLNELLNNKDSYFKVLKKTVQEKYGFVLEEAKKSYNIRQLAQHHQTCKDNIIKSAVFNTYHLDEHYVKHNMILETIALSEELTDTQTYDAKAISQELLDIGRILSSGQPEEEFYREAEDKFGVDVANELYWMFNPFEDSEYPSTVQSQQAEAKRNIEKGIRDNIPAIMFIIDNINEIEKLAETIASN